MPVAEYVAVGRRIELSIAPHKFKLYESPRKLRWIKTSTFIQHISSHVIKNMFNLIALIALLWSAMLGDLFTISLYPWKQAPLPIAGADL